MIHIKDKHVTVHNGKGYCHGRPASLNSKNHRLFTHSYEIIDTPYHMDATSTSFGSGHTDTMTANSNLMGASAPNTESTEKGKAAASQKTLPNRYPATDHVIGLPRIPRTHAIAGPTIKRRSPQRAKTDNKHHTPTRSQKTPRPQQRRASPQHNASSAAPPRQTSGPTCPT